MNYDSSPEPSNALTEALEWIRLALTGSLATTVAIIAVASFGLMLISGRLSHRRGTQLIFGCFIIFGASSIAAGITDALGVFHMGDGEYSPSAPAVNVGPIPPQRPVTNTPYDPYAGAALPPHR